MRCLIIGHGSIGQRHARLLAEMGHEVAVLSRRQVDIPMLFHSLDQALAWNPGYVVVANATAEHATSLSRLAAAGYGGTVLVEKPMSTEPLVSLDFPFHLHVGFNLRFHPVIRDLAVRIADHKLFSAQAYVGQYLPDWRPDTDYRQCYSAKAAEGGGVVFDLSHELDYLLHLFGSWRRVAALGGHFSDLEIDSVDTAQLLLECDRCPAVSVELNYLDRMVRRDITINGDFGTIRANLVAGTVIHNGETTTHQVPRDSLYIAQHAEMTGGGAKFVCSAPEGQLATSLAVAAHRAMTSGQWIVP